MMFSIFVVEDNDGITGSLRLGKRLLPAAFGGCCCRCLGSFSVGGGALDKHVISMFCISIEQVK